MADKATTASDRFVATCAERESACACVCVCVCVSHTVGHYGGCDEGASPSAAASQGEDHLRLPSDSCLTTETPAEQQGAVSCRVAAVTTLQFSLTVACKEG